MAPEDVLDVERSATEALGDLDDVRRSDKQEQGAGVDEATNKPRAGYPVDLWAWRASPIQFFPTHQQVESWRRAPKEDWPAATPRILLPALLRECAEAGAEPPLLDSSSNRFGRLRLRSAQPRQPVGPLVCRDHNAQKME